MFFIIPFLFCKQDNRVLNEHYFTLGSLAKPKKLRNLLLTSKINCTIKKQDTRQ